MPINDDVSKHIKLIEKKNIETFQMDPIYEINSQFAQCWQINFGQIKIIIT